MDLIFYFLLLYALLALSKFSLFQIRKLFEVFAKRLNSRDVCLFFALIFQLVSKNLILITTL